MKPSARLLLLVAAVAATLFGCDRRQSGTAAAPESLPTKGGYFDGVDLEEALLELRPTEALREAAQAGNVKAQILLARRYYRGDGVEKDLVQAVAWWRKAADQGDASAQFALGGAYADGDGVAKDAAQAIAWWTRAAESGDTNAQFMLGVSHEKGRMGLDKDAAKAVEWWRKAAALGDSAAQFNIGVMYANGEGVPKNDITAAEWFVEAAANGHVDAQAAIGTRYRLGIGVPRDGVLAYAWLNLAAGNGSDKARERRDRLELPPEQIAEAQRLSSGWKKSQTLVREGASGGVPAPLGAVAKRGMGTAFWVSKAGHAITNNHIVDGCREVRASGRDGAFKVVTADVANDIALLQLGNSVAQTAPVSSASPPVRQGENVVVFGFPLNAVLSSGGNITPGVISALSGLGNDTNQIQITAPIQPGSSGSPVLNMKGEVVGVVMGKLSDNKVSRATGQVPQNVNFAVNGQTLKTFLDTHKVEYRTGGMLMFSQSAADLADEARKWTLVVECWR